MYADQAAKLVKEAKRTENILPEYNTELVRDVQREIRTLHHNTTVLLRQYDIRNSTENDPGATAAILIHHRSLERNKRCLLAYHYHRLKKIKEYCWELGHVPQELITNLSALEMDFSTDYQSIINDYSSNFTGIDLSSSLDPPKDPYIEVRVLKDCGEIYTENGLVTLSKNSQHYLRRTDVEHLINEGYLKHIK
ncbi:PSF1 domain-containing protein [Neocallimastix lanati (nom. inval.)]|uniref:DNA replication complex GINS protein PSF1 n=1 Tax=Neocallimastix californiae TaxID=1754190 RepID=A0A1Y2C946_9FUNG|nr:PSF1 domain-containing protein [Neocallimastix sp. JGI-2020a]ORY43563.1 PSF1 domain-containing protein [Neocallimastix californiae]|eukprot:ORY43563.1 PSF1 domain-containing protein [Neocallimastix californiae]